MVSMTFIPYEFPKSRDGKYFAAQTEDRILLSRREQLGLTQQQVADLAQIQLRQYQRIESGERSLTSSSLRIGLSICAALLLDPYSMIGITIEQPDPNTMQPQYTFDAPKTLDDTFAPKKVGRRVLRRDIMIVYLNHNRYSLILSPAVFQALGTPQYFQCLYSKKDCRFALRAAEPTDEEAMDVPEEVYDGCFLVLGGASISEKLRSLFHWTDELYSADAFLVKDKNGEYGVIVDIVNAKPTEPVSGPFVTPKCLEDEDDFAEDDEESEEDED